MRKYVSLLVFVCVVCCIVVFSGCTDSYENNIDGNFTTTLHNEETTAEITAGSVDGTDNVIDLSSVLADINSQYAISADDMMVIEDTDSLELFYNILPEDVKQFAAETTINTATDITELIFVEAVDSAAADRIYNALDIRYNSQKDLCASYSAELLDVINRCSVEKNGNFISLIMSGDSADITELYNSYFK